MPAQTRVDVVSSAAAAVMTEVDDEIRHLLAAQGRAGVVVALRRTALALARSGVARDQLKRRALEVAADDLAWGRRPLAHWPQAFAEASCPTEESRLAVRRSLPADAAPADLRAQTALAAEIEARVLREGPDAFFAAILLPERLAEEAELQARLWDDPRISADAEARGLMRAAERGLRVRLQAMDHGCLDRLAATRPAPGFLSRLAGLFRAGDDPPPRQGPRA